MTNTNEFKQTVLKYLELGALFKLDPDANSTFINSYRECNGRRYFTCIETGEIKLAEEHGVSDNTIVYEHNLDEVKQEEEIQLDVIIEGLTHEVVDSIKKLDLMLFTKREALDDLDAKDPNMYEYLKEITEEQYKLLTMANNIRPKLNK